MAAQKQTELCLVYVLEWWNNKSLIQWFNIYYERTFCSLLVFFLAPTGLGKILHNSQNIHAYYMLNHRIRCIKYFCLSHNVVTYDVEQQGQWNKNSRSMDGHDQETQQQEDCMTVDRRGNDSPKLRGLKCVNHSC